MNHMISPPDLNSDPYAYAILPEKVLDPPQRNSDG